MGQGKILLVIFLGFVTIWDMTTTVTGTSEILGDSGISFFLSVVFALMLALLLVKTIPIMYHPNKDLLHTSAKVLWGAAISYDMFTSFIGNKSLIESTGSTFDIPQLAVVVGMTVFVSSSPVVISYLLYSADGEMVNG